MADNPPGIYIAALNRAKEAFQAGLQGDTNRAQELLWHTRNELKRLSGDLPIVGRDENADAPFATRRFEEAQAWGWLELAAGMHQLSKEHPGAALVHFKRAWRIWRPWSTEQIEARREKTRAALWLGEAWARVMGERASHAAQAILRAALTEIVRLQAQDLLQETLAQQAKLPPAPPGSAAYQQPAPYIHRLLQP